MKTRTYATPFKDDPSRKPNKLGHAQKNHNSGSADGGDIPAKVARVLAMQHTMGNSLTQRAVRGHAHGHDCTCIACKPRINQAGSGYEKPASRHDTAQDAAQASGSQSKPDIASPKSATAFMFGGDDVQRWWDDDENESDDSSNSSSGNSDSGGSWLSGLNPFSSDEDSGNQNTSGGANVATGSTHTHEGGEDSDSGGEGGWFNQLNPFSSDKDNESGGGNSDDDSWWSKLNPFGGGGKDDESGGGGWNPFGDWNPFKDFNPFGGFQPLAGVEMPEKAPDWWPSDWWPFGNDKKDDQGGGDQPGEERNPMPVGDNLRDSAVVTGGHTVGCMTSDEEMPAAIAGQTPDSRGMIKLTVNPQIATSTSVEENFNESSQHPLAEMSAGTSVTMNTSNDIKRNDGFAAATNQYGVTDGKYQLAGQKWNYDDNSNVINYSNTLKQNIVWGINTSKTIALTGADDPQINASNYEIAAQSMEHFAGRTGAEGPGTTNPAYWSPGLTERHEQVHVKQLQDRVAKEIGTLNSRIGAVTVDVPSWWGIWTQAQSGWSKREQSNVTWQLENAIITPGGIFEKWAAETSKAYAASCEAPAYADGKGEFQKVADNIRARAKREKWK